jgi:hypothetical protein
MANEVIWGKILNSSSETWYSEKKINSTREWLISNLESKLPHVDIKKEINVMWYEWEGYIIDLPAVWDFEGSKFSIFVSYDDVSKSDFERNPELEKKSKSIKDLWSLLMAINKYMKALGLETDWVINYEEDIKYIIGSYDNGKKKSECIAWNYFKHITWLNNKMFWVKDNCEYRGFKFRYYWNISRCRSGENCFFNYEDNDYSYKLLLDLPDYV